MTALARSAGVRAAYSQQGAEPGTMSQQAFTRFVDAELVRWNKVITAANVRLE